MVRVLTENSVATRGIYGSQTRSMFDFFEQNVISHIQNINQRIEQVWRNNISKINDPRRGTCETKIVYHLDRIILQGGREIPKEVVRMIIWYILEELKYIYIDFNIFTIKKVMNETYFTPQKTIKKIIGEVVVIDWS